MPYSHEAYFSVGHLTFLDPSVVAPSPIQVALGTMKEITLKVSKSLVALEGELEYPVDFGIAGRAIEGSYKAVEWRADALKHFLQATETLGRYVPVDGELATIPSSPYQTTVAGGGANFGIDLGVWDVTAGKPMKRAADGTAQASLTTGQYTVSVTGQFTWATPDVAHQVQHRYTTLNATQGRTFEIPNVLQGLSKPLRGLFLNQNAAGRDYGWDLYAIHVEALDLAFKAKEWNDHGGTFKVAADANRKVGRIYRPA